MTKTAIDADDADDPASLAARVPRSGHRQGVAQQLPPRGRVNAERDDTEGDPVKLAARVPRAGYAPPDPNIADIPR